MKYLITGAAFIDNIVYPDGRRIDKIKGGCGIYAYSGVKLYEDDCQIVLGIGEDFEELYGDWFDVNGISRDGLFIKDEHTAQTVLTYEANGHYTSKNIYSGKHGYHNPALALSMDELEPFLSEDVKGIYLQSDIYGNYGKAYDLKDKYGYRIMWELPPWPGSDYRSTMEKTIEKCDIWSLNIKESFDIFGVDSEEEAIRAIQSLKVPCFYRVGDRGSYMVMPDGAYFMPSVHFVPDGDNVDPTGCGNCSTAAAMWAFCEGKTPKEICSFANVAAGYNAMQRGPYPKLRDAREKACFYAVKIAGDLK